MGISMIIVIRAAARGATLSHFKTRRQAVAACVADKDTRGMKIRRKS